MGYLFVKFLRDIRKQWSQFFSVFMMAMISMTIFAGMSCVWNGLKESRDSYFEATNLADFCVYGNNISEKDQELIAKLSSVKEADLSMCLQVDGPQYGAEDTDIILNTVSNTQAVLKPLLRKGEEIDNQDGIWIDEDYAKVHSLSIGDNIDLTISNQIISVEVKGTVLDSENTLFITSGTSSIPDHEHHGYAYLNESYAKKLFGKLNFNQLRLHTTNDIEKEQLEMDVKAILGMRYYSMIKVDEVGTIAEVNEEIDQIVKMAILFSAVFILLSLLTMYTTMKRLISNQIVQLGTMKAMGYFNWQIYLHYALYGVFVSVLGGLIGIILGQALVAELVLNVKKATLSLPEWNKVIGAENYILWGIIILICVISTLLTVRKVIRMAPAQTIRGLTEQGQHRKHSQSARKLQKTPQSPKCSYGVIWNLRAIKVHPTRTAMGIIAVAGSLVLMVAGVGIWDSITNSYTSVFDKEYSYEYAANIKTGMSEDVMEELKDCNVQYVQSKNTTFTHGEKESEGTLTILDDGDMVHLYQQNSNNEIKLPDKGTVMTNKMANTLGIQKGDTVIYQADQSSEQIEIEVMEIVNAKLPQGIFLSKKAYEGAFEANTIYLKNEQDKDIAEKCEKISGLISIEKQRENMNIMLNSVQSITYILIFAAFLLSAVILYNLGTLSYLERNREYATMKVLGFYKKEINTMVLGDSLCNLIVGILIGIPCSSIFLKVYVSTVSMDSMEWTPYIASLHMAAIVLVVSVFSLLVHLLICRKVKRVDMVEAMKAMD